MLSKSGLGRTPRSGSLMTSVIHGLGSAGNSTPFERPSVLGVLARRPLGAEDRDSRPRGCWRTRRPAGGSRSCGARSPSPPIAVARRPPGQGTPVRAQRRVCPRGVPKIVNAFSLRRVSPLRGVLLQAAARAPSLREADAVFHLFAVSRRRRTWSAGTARSSRTAEYPVAPGARPSLRRFLRHHTVPVARVDRLHPDPSIAGRPLLRPDPRLDRSTRKRSASGWPRSSTSAEAAGATASSPAIASGAVVVRISSSVGVGNLSAFGSGSMHVRRRHAHRRLIAFVQPGSSAAGSARRQSGT